MYSCSRTNTASGRLNREPSWISTWPHPQPRLRKIATWRGRWLRLCFCMDRCCCACCCLHLLVVNSADCWMASCSRNTHVDLLSTRSIGVKRRVSVYCDQHSSFCLCVWSNRCATRSLFLSLSLSHTHTHTHTPVSKPAPDWNGTAVVGNPPDFKDLKLKDFKGA